jgi:exopolyphosphatase/guanosine-5'-triphosphate,3'-diphosphate pyrophosphatase
MAEQPAESRELLAALDLGSNSFHLVVARLSNGQLVVVDRLREMVRLGSGVDETGRLSKQAASGALECLSRFGQRLAGIPRENVRAVGTNALRRARNRSEFLQLAEQALGHSIQVISGIEEARLVYLGAAKSLPPDPKRRLVLDIGGGSTEIILGEGMKTHALESLHMGCVSMSDRYFAHGKISAEAFHEAELAASLELRPVKNTFRRLGWENVVGASGTIRAVAAMLQELRGDREITLAGLDELKQMLIAEGSVSEAHFHGLSVERRPVLPGGLAVLRQLFVTFGIEKIRVAEGALREGLLYDLLGRLSHEDERERSIRNMQMRFHVDQQQAERVEMTALGLLDQVSTQWDLTSALARQVLCWGARVHEVGLDIAHSQYQKHGAYLLQHADMPGFPKEEQYLLSALVLNHRRKLYPDIVTQLPQGWHRKTWRLILLLRLAVVLHRTRAPDDVPIMMASVEGETLRVVFPPGWLQEHPLTLADLRQEEALLRKIPVALEYS